MVERSARSRLPSHALAVVLTAGFLSLATPAGAAFTVADIKCREAIAKRGTALAKATVSALVECQALKVAQGLPTDFDCRISANADFRAKVARNVGRLSATAAKKCGARPPAELGYLGCPFPCDGSVPSLTTYGDVGSCLACVVNRDTENLVAGALGNPPVPLGDAESQCHGVLGSTQAKQFATVIREKRRCQKAAEKHGTMDTSACVAAMPTPRVIRARAAAESMIGVSCEDADLAALDSCAEITVPTLASCVLGSARSIGTHVFKSLYGLALGAGATTTTFGGTVTTTTVSSTTTTTLDTTFDHLCSLTVRVTSNELLGSLKYVIDYGPVSGGFLGSGLGVQCTNLVSGASRSFFDDETNRVMRESLISVDGFTNPRDIAQCSFETDDAGLVPPDFTLTVTDAATPDLVIVNPTVVISTITCGPQ